MSTSRLRVNLTGLQVILAATAAAQEAKTLRVSFPAEREEK
jgi:hypothetical protein